MSSPVSSTSQTTAASPRPTETHSQLDPSHLPGMILFYDGTCGFCAGIVQFILKNERSRNTLRFAPLQGSTAAALRTRHPALASVDSVIWYQPSTSTRPERLLVRSDAGLTAIAYLGGLWHLLATLSWCVPRPIRDAVYDSIARNRHRITRNDTCFVPSPAQRARFID